MKHILNFFDMLINKIALFLNSLVSIIVGRCNWALVLLKQLMPNSFSQTNLER